MGNPPLVTLAAAREQALENKRLVRAGGDPLAEKRRAREVLTFSGAVDIYLAGKMAEFRNEKHRKQWRATLDTYAASVIGSKPVQDVQVRDVLRVLEPIWTVKTEPRLGCGDASKPSCHGRLSRGTARAIIPRWRGNLSEMLAKPGKVARGENQPALSLADVPRWCSDLREREGMAARALQFLTMCAARSGEVRGMTWGEVDLGSADGASRTAWTIPGSRMKAGR